ncbi:hypothetical protein GSbR_05190 [Geobacter sp. SVR]|nr:hypothetical protein GSVR_09520 [Geobacter sp. SVR]GCF83919.1 hypothetical protein GSbR_05190 [Geobacter sp. SVR]
MPNPASQFIGRQHDLGELVETLRQKRSVSIEGPGGIGKTQILLNALKLSSDPRPVLWMNIEAYRTVNDLKRALLSALSKPGSPADSCSIVDMLADKEVRLVFDGVEQMSPADMDDIEDFFGTLLTMTTTPQFIFTSQVELINLDLEKRLQLDPISKESSLLILESALVPELRNFDCETEVLCSLVEFCQGHPLTLQITAGLLRYFKSASTVMEKIQRSGSVAIQNPTRRRQNTHTSLHACLSVSYQTLTFEQRKVLWMAAQCPAGFLVDMLAEAIEFGFVDYMADVAALRRWHLVDVNNTMPFGTRLYVLSPIRAFVNSEFHENSSHDIEELECLLVMDMTAQARFLDSNFMQVGDVALGLQLFSIELPNFLNGLQISLDRASEKSLKLAASMAGCLMVYCFVNGFVQLGIEILQMGADAAARIGNKHQASELLVRLLALAERSANTEIASSTVSELISLADDSSDPVLIANAANGRGVLAQMNKQTDVASEAFAVAAVEYEKIAQMTANKFGQTNENEYQGNFNWAKHMLAMTLKQQGTLHEHARRPVDALQYYERAIALVEEGSDQINIGSLLHHMGNCAAEMNQKQKAFEYYLAAANKFQTIQFEEYLSNSLAELGYLLVGWEPPSPFDSLLTEELMADGLLDVARQVERAFLPLSSELSGQCSQTLRKVFGIFILASFSSKNRLLADWAFHLREEVILSFVEQEGWGERSMGDKIWIMYLDLTLALAGSVSAVEQPDGIGTPSSLSEIEHYARLCYKYFDFGWEIFHPFEWLTIYLCRHRGLSAIQPDTLLSAAEAAETLGHDFSIFP